MRGNAFGQYTDGSFMHRFPQYLAGFMFTNSRTRGARARRELGWSPKYTAQDFVSGLPAEVEVLVKKFDAEAKSSA